MADRAEVLIAYTFAREEVCSVCCASFLVVCKEVQMKAQHDDLANFDFKLAWQYDPVAGNKGEDPRSIRWQLSS
jgi:hypothetical protein